MGPDTLLDDVGSVPMSELGRPWVEKYRPSNIDEIVQQESVISSLRGQLSTGELPHLLFHGPPGTGKTSTALALCRTLFGDPDVVRRRVLELNASDERGIANVRSKVKQFAQLAVGPGGIPFKVIILDEADSMTPDAQNALRRIMEEYMNVTRFIIICNYISRIGDPIVSRCAKFCFHPLSAEGVVGRLAFIAQSEAVGMSPPDEVLQALVAVSSGDLRRAITFLQSAAAFPVVTPDLIYEIAGVPPRSLLEGMFEAGALRKPWPELEAACDEVALAGYDPTKCLSILADIVMESPAIDEYKRARLIARIAQADAAITARADTRIQFYAVAAEIGGCAK